MNFWNNRLILLLSSLVLCVVNCLPGIVETIAGGGDAHKGKKNDCNDIENSKDGYDINARFNYPWGIAYDHNNNVVYVADCGCINSGHRTDKIRKIDLSTNKVSTIAGSTQGFADGFGNEAHFQHIAGITLDPELEMLYIADSGNNRIRVLYIATNKVETISGLSTAGLIDQSTVSSLFNNPQSVVVYRTETGERVLYVADTDNHAIRVIHLRGDHSGYVKTLAGGTKGFQDGIKLGALFNSPSDIAIDGIGTYLYIADHLNHAIRRLEISTGEVQTLGSEGFGSIIPGARHMVFHYPDGLVFDPDYHVLYVCEFEKGTSQNVDVKNQENHDIRVITLDGLVKTLAGEHKGNQDGVGKVAKFYHPTGLGFDRKNRILFVADQYNHLVRSVSGIGSNKSYVPNAYQRRINDRLRKFEALEQKKLKLSSYPTILWIACGFTLLLFGSYIFKPSYRYLITIGKSYIPYR